MKTISGYKNFTREEKPAYLALGAFDGIHFGHQKLIDETIKKARENDGIAVILTFHPHPRTFISHEKPFGLINTYEEKIELIAGTGIDKLLIVEFDDEIANMTPGEFCEKIIAGAIGAREVFVGFNFFFGHNRAGDALKLKEFGEKYGFLTNVIEPFEVSCFVVSSSKIRLLIETGAVEDAISFMGRPYSFVGDVVRGDGLGRRLNIPTANIRLSNPEKVLPKNGVYIVEGRIGDKTYKGLMNIGTRPTIYEKRSSLVTFELHFLGFKGDLYDHKIEVFLLKRIRDEKRFADMTELFNQINNDIREACEFFNITPERLEPFKTANNHND